MSTKTKTVPGSSRFLDNIMKYFSFSAIIILLVGLSLTQENFLGEINLKNLLRDTAPLMIMAAGMTMVLLFGSIDLSMGAVCSVSNVAFVHFMLAYGESFGSPVLAGLAALAVSLAFGLCSGLALTLYAAGRDWFGVGRSKVARASTKSEVPNPSSHICLPSGFGGETIIHFDCCAGSL